VPKKQRKQNLGEELMSEAGLAEYVDKRTVSLKVECFFFVVFCLFFTKLLNQDKEAKLRAIRNKKNSAKKRKPIKRGK
jgi:hypothetical protein